MSKILLDRIELKNFYSYGNTWQAIDLHEGINVVLGYDKDKERSNGAGKTSFLEAIPFALFGQTSKGVPLGKIINWKNGKQCEVRLFFRKDGVSYELHRGIKPGLLELVKDGTKVPKLSDKRVFQAELESDLIGMDFRAGQSIHFQNANNMISMFDTPKAEKRKFIEKFFNVEIYSKLNELVNSKLRGLEQKRSDLDSERSFKLRRISELEQEINGCAAPDIASYEHTVNTAEANLKGYREDHADFLIDVTDLQTQVGKDMDEKVKLEEELEGLTGQKRAVELEMNSLQTLKGSLAERLSEIGDLTEQREKLDKLKAGLAQIGDLETEAKEARTVIEELQLRVNAANEAQAQCRTQMKIAGDNLNEWKNKSVLEAGECPTCFQDADPEHIKGHIEEQCKIYAEEIDAHQITIAEGVDRLDTLNAQLSEAKERMEKAESRNSMKLVIEKKIAGLSNITEKEAEVAKINESIAESDRKEEVQAEILGGYIAQIDVIKGYLGETTDRIDQNKATIDRTTRAKAEELILEETVKNEKKILEAQREIAERIDGEQQARIASKAQMETELSQWDSKYKKLDTMQDYLKYIKESLKDENVKQYAISNLVPFVQQQTNHYLSETGHSYYVELDNWLDGEIKGFGVGDCDFGNMSGGEGKSIDLALKFAMMDVARRQAGSYLDILVLDELLDSSIDSFGLEKTVDIVKLKQSEDDLKVFVVSHREEIGAFDFDRTYNVVKENGFSTINVA
jgi:DNA repair exonuclease SbcCD ATPase subunit